MGSKPSSNTSSAMVLSVKIIRTKHQPGPPDRMNRHNWFSETTETHVKDKLNK